MNPLKIILPVLLFSVISCGRFSPVFMEEQAGDEKNSFQYFSEPIEKWEEIFKLDQRFRKNTIGAKDRINYSAYSRIFFDENSFPKRIENYRRHDFNTHVYYPYQIFVIEVKENEIMITQTLKKWENQSLIDDSVVIKAFEKQKDADFLKLMEVLVQSPEDRQFENQTFVFKYIPEDNESNKRLQEAIASDQQFITLEGFEEAHFNFRIRLHFFDALRSEAGLLPLGQATLIRAKLSKIASGGVLEFIFISIEKEKPVEDSSIKTEMYKSEHK